MTTDGRPGRTHYDVLGVDQGATTDEIRHAYRALVRRHHPDHLGERGADPKLRADAERRIRELTAAWQVLRDPLRRADYDRRFVTTDDRTTYSPYPPGTEEEPPGGFDEWFSDADVRRSAARVVSPERRPTKPFRPRLLIGFGVVLLIGILLIVTITGNGGDDVPPAVGQGRCVRLQPGAPAVQVPCSQTNDGQVIGQVNVAGKCPNGAAGERLTTSDTKITCLARQTP